MRRPTFLCRYEPGAALHVVSHKVPGLANFWIPPIRNRIEMLATGIKSPIGVNVSGANLGEIDHVAREIEGVAKNVPGISSALAERLTGGRYIDVNITARRQPDTA